MTRKSWTRDELILTFNLYCKTPYDQIHSHNPEIIGLANLLDRPAAEIAQKLAGFARLDLALDEQQVAGAAPGGRLEIDIWQEFNGDWERLAFESEALLAQKANKPLEVLTRIDITDLPKEGKEREAKVRVRVNQSFFRSTVLAAYGSRCCITGLKVPELLNARPILPWSVNQAERVNPSNGLCLNLIHDQAFDRGLITVTTDLRVKVSPLVKVYCTENAIQDIYLKYEGARIQAPQRFRPNLDFLDFHNRCIYRS